MTSTEPILAQKVDDVELDEQIPIAPVDVATDPFSNPEIDTPTEMPQIRRKPAKKKIDSGEEGIVAALCAWVVDHQIGIAVNLLLLLTLTHVCYPKARQYTTKFFTLSHYNPQTGRYAVGLREDACLVFYYFVVFSGLRIFIMDYMMTPLAQMLGLDKKDKVRFAEQAWVLTYYTVFWCLGMYLVVSSENWTNLRNLWTARPDREMDGLFKWYYLVQYAFWLQQIVGLNIEARRKDHVQMLTHHIVTCILMFTSYGYHYTKVGNVILCLMDTVDVVFPAAKMLKYLKFQKTCDVFFGLFMVSWIITRHIIYSMVVYSIYSDLPDVTDLGCYRGSNANLEGPFEPPDRFMHHLSPFIDQTGVICQTQTTTNWYVGLLGFLQVILLVWFTMIIRVASKVIRGEAADDIRSDDEDEEEELEYPSEKQPLSRQGFIEVPPPLEEDVGVEDINLSGRKVAPAKVSRRGHGMASGVSLPSDKKELLGRIGCDKGA